MENIEAKDPGVLEHSTVGYVICPPDAHNVPQTAQVERVLFLALLYINIIEGPGAFITSSLCQILSCFLVLLRFA